MNEFWNISHVTWLIWHESIWTVEFIWTQRRIMHHNLFIPQLCCMPRSNPRTNVPFKDSIMIVPICLKTIHQRQSLWLLKSFQKNSIADEKLSKRFIRNVFVSVPDHSNLKWFQPWHEFYLGLFQVSFAFYSQFIILFLLWSRVSHNSVKCEIKKQNFGPSQSYRCQVGNVSK